MSKFTSGPWVPFDRGIGWEVHNEDGWCINDGHRETFTEADARLIAAAPEMYEVLAAITGPADFEINAELYNRAKSLLARINGDA